MMVSAVILEADGNSYRVKLPSPMEIDTSKDDPPDAWKNLLAILWTIAREIERRRLGE